MRFQLGQRIFHVERPRALEVVALYGFFVLGVVVDDVEYRGVECFDYLGARALRGENDVKRVDL